MNKVFLYLYPIEEFYRSFLFSDDYYKEKNRERPFDVLNDCIQKRYRDKGYTIAYALYPDKKVFGIELMSSDKIIYTDITFKDASGYNEDGSEKSEDEIKYPSEKCLLEQLGDVEKLVVGGFHFRDCVKRFANYAYEKGVDTLIDLDLTDLFFNLYYRKDYFKKDEYSVERYKDMWMSSGVHIFDISRLEAQFRKMYDSPTYGFYENENIAKKQR